MILIVDFGSQTAHLIGRRLRQLGVAYLLVSPEEALDTIKEKSFKGIILSGGPASVYEEGAPTIDKAIFEQNIPVLGICYGWQLMAQKLGGEVKSGAKEYGPIKVQSNEVDQTCPLWKNLPSEFQVFMSHGDSVLSLPTGFEYIASSESLPAVAVANMAAKLYGVQFHPEVKHTQFGQEILQNFVTICQETISPFQLSPEKIISEIKEKVGDKKVICAVSGGVDSTVAAFFIGKAIGKNLIPVYVESGLMRKGTEERVREIFTQNIEADLVVVDARKLFLDSLQGVTDPETKRKIIGKLYVDIFTEQAEKHTDVQFLGQGTIYSDVIESKGTKYASHIKSHHNVGGLPKDLKFSLLEPMREYYKDEVRELGNLVGLPKEIVMQQPVPGPGYAVRIRGEVTEKRLAQVIISDEIVVEEMQKANLYERAFQCFSIMSGAYSTAVKGDARAFAEVVAIRAYESDDIMTAGIMQIPYDVLGKIAGRIVNEVPDVSRVVYDITTKPPATMEWE